MPRRDGSPWSPETTVSAVSSGAVVTQAKSVAPLTAGDPAVETRTLATTGSFDETMIV